MLLFISILVNLLLVIACCKLCAQNDGLREAVDLNRQNYDSLKKRYDLALTNTRRHQEEADRLTKANRAFRESVEAARLQLARVRGLR